MGEKQIRTNRKNRSVKTDPNQTKTSNTDIKLKPCANATNYDKALKAMMETGWGYCTEEQLEEILLKQLEFSYNEAINKLIALGYDKDVCMKAVLKSGHCYGAMEIMTNVVHNTLGYLNGRGEENGRSFADLRKLEEYSLKVMVALLRQVKPNLSKGDAMWCLLMSDLHVGRASVMETPILSVGGDVGGNGSEGVVGNEGIIGVDPELCRFHGGWGFGNSGTCKSPSGFMSYASEMGMQKEIECPKRFNLSPSMKRLLNRNVAMFAAGFRANAKHFQSPGPSHVGSSSLSGGSAVNRTGESDESNNAKNQEVVDSVMSKFKDLNLDENSEPGSLDKKDSMILSLVRQLKELEKQVKERKEWAHQKAIQAAGKLSHDLTELKTLRMEKEEIQRLKKGKQIVEDNTMKRLSEMENAFRKASAQVDRANAAVKKLQTENAEIRAEMEASKLSASESVTTCLEVAKREKKTLKRLLAWEKQKAKKQEDIASEKQKIAEVQQELDEVEAATKDIEAKWRLEQNAKEQVLVQLEQERRLKEASEAQNKSNLESLRLKIEINFQRHKDDLQRLEQEYARLKESSRSSDLDPQSNKIWAQNSSNFNQQGETIARLLDELNQLEDSSGKEGGSDRDCIICMNNEVSVVFLPCAHQVICANCNDSYGKKKKGKATCCYCRAPIEERIRIFGASS